jgi:hypothetical protein
MDENEIPEDLRDLVVLEFTNIPQSSSYARVMKLAQSMSKYRKIGTGRDEKHFIGLVESEKIQWFEIYNLVLNWKTSRIHFKEINASARYQLGIISCYLDGIKSSEMDKYCFLNNWIGCQKIYEGRSLDLCKGAGCFLSDKEFKPDKDYINKNINDSIYRFSLCPIYNFSRIEKSIQELPAIINFDTDKKWKPILEFDSLGEGIHIVGIKYSSEQIAKNAPFISDVDKLGAFTIRNHGLFQDFNEVWEHRIIILSRDQYSRESKNGNLSEITALGQKGWQLVTIFSKENELHFILQRKRPF